MHFPDHSHYRYMISILLPDVQNIGWLSAGQPFPTGDAEGWVLPKLRRVLEGEHTNQTRGYHQCEFCEQNEVAVELESGERLLLGSAEIWVPGDGVLFAAPTLLYHYIERHNYVPPAEFLAALKRFDPSTCSGQVEFNSRVARAKGG